MNWISRIDVIVLALLLAYVLVVFVRVSYHLRPVRLAAESDSDLRNFRKLVADLNAWVGNLKAIATAAPYLGLAGTSFGIMSIFRGIAMERSAAQALLTSIISVALVTAGVGILVAVPANCLYNHLRTRLDSLDCKGANPALLEARRQLRTVKRFPLAKRFSLPPPFALIVTPCLAMAVAAFMTFTALHPPMGLDIELAPARCEFDGDDRPIVLRVTNSDEIFINSERADWNSLSGRLSRIYSLGKCRVLYLLAEDNVPFQTVADAIDIIENAPLDGSDSADIRVRLVTPAAMKARCLEPLAIRSARHVAK